MSLLVSTGASVGGDVGPNVSTVSINIYVYRVFFYILNQLNIQIRSYLDKIHLKEIPLKLTLCLMFIGYVRN